MQRSQHTGDRKMKKTLILSALALVASSADYNIAGSNDRVGIRTGTIFNNTDDLFDLDSDVNQNLNQNQDSVMKNFTAGKTTDNIFNLGATRGGLSSTNGALQTRDGHSGASHSLGGHMLAPSFESTMGFSQGNSGGQSIGDTAGSGVSGSTFAFGPSQVSHSDKSVTNLRGDVAEHTGDRNMFHTDNSKYALTDMKDNNGDDQRSNHEQ
jgi:hypothetical protein